MWGVSLLLYFLGKEPQRKNLGVGFHKLGELLEQTESYFRYFRNPCDNDRPAENFKNFKFFTNSRKILTFTFGEIAFTFGKITFTFGEVTFTFGEIRDSRRFLGFWNFFFCCSRGFGTPWVGGPRRGFRKYLNHIHCVLSPKVGEGQRSLIGAQCSKLFPDYLTNPKFYLNNSKRLKIGKGLGSKGIGN